MASLVGSPSVSVIFQVRAATNFGDKIVLVGSGDAMGNWDPEISGLALSTTAEDYPLWKSSPVILAASTLGAPLAEYKYVRIKGDGKVEWEAYGENRKVPADALQEARLVVDDGHFSTISCECFGFQEGLQPQSLPRIDPGDTGLRLVVVGDDVAAGYGAWGYQGWAPQLGRALNAFYGYGYCNVAQVGLCGMEAMKQGLAAPLPTPTPQVVVIAFSLQLKWLATCPEWDRGNIVGNNLKALEALIKATWELGAMPVIAGLCPHGDFGEEQAKLLREADAAMKRLGVPVLDWLHVLSKSGESFGTWCDELSHGAEHPNSSGHRRMFSAVDLTLFEPAKVTGLLSKRAEGMKADKDVLFSDGNGFEMSYSVVREELTLSNTTSAPYEINPSWDELRNALEEWFRASPWSLRRGLYVRAGLKQSEGEPLSVYIGLGGRLESQASVPAGCSVTLSHSSQLPGCLHESKKVIFQDGPLLMFQEDNSIVLCNEADCEYNVHPMWAAVRQALKSMGRGVWEDGSGMPFRTAVISAHGLQSRVKVPGKSMVQLRRSGDLSSLKMIAVLPLGDRCSIRMLLHKIEYDGPCYPFDLTRTTSLADVADMVATGFTDMWNEEQLFYDHEAGRVFHRRWGGLSFAHEVDEGDDPVGNFHAVAQRMCKRYTGRAARFDWACHHADSVLFMRTGIASRDEVVDLLARMKDRYPKTTATLLLISDQPSEEFDGLQTVRHVREFFDPDKMYEDMSYWIDSAHRFRGILDDMGINARSLYWCPNDLKEAQKELNEEEARAASDVLPEVPPVLLQTSDIAKFSHANLYELQQVPQLQPAAPTRVAAVGA